MYKVLGEMKESLKASRNIITIRQRIGNRYMNVFTLFFAISIGMVSLYIYITEHFGFKKRTIDLRYIYKI